MSTRPGNPAATPAGDIVARLEVVESFITCARETAKAENTNEGNAISDVLLHVENMLYGLRRAIDPGIDADLQEGGAA